MNLRVPATTRRSGSASTGSDPQQESAAAGEAHARFAAPRGKIHPDRDLGWIRRLWPVVAGHRGIFAIALGASIVSLLCGVAVPRIMMAAIDQALDHRTRALSGFIFLIAGLGLVRGIGGYISRSFLFRVAYAIENDLRVLLFEHFSRLSFSFYDRVQSGQLISRANSDIRTLQMFLTFGPLMCLTLLSFAAAIGLMLTISVPLTVVTILPLPFVAILGARLGRLTFPISWIVQARQAELATTVEENLSGVRVVKAFAGERSQIEQFDQIARQLQWINIRQAEVQAANAPAMEAMPRIGTAMVLLIGGWLTMEGHLTIGAIVAFTTYVVMLQAPFRMFGFFLMMLQRAAASALRIYEVLDEDPEVVDRTNATDLHNPSGTLEFRNVFFRYADGPRVLDDFSLKIPAGQSIAIVGRTGCGKSTVGRLLARFYDVNEGVVLIDGEDVRDFTLESLRAQVGVVAEDPFLFTAAIHDNIAYARPTASREEVREAARAAGALEFIENLPEGFDSVIGERGYDLSGGQRQRISIARSLLANPRILILDDATSAIDVHVERTIHEKLGDLLVNRTTIVIAHRLSTIALADRVILIDEGRVIADGKHADLMRTESRYSEVLAHFGEEEEQEVTP
jgi:ATP-binding cassette subfamily B protein